jgi:thymidylate synthase (FAD)
MKLIKPGFSVRYRPVIRTDRPSQGWELSLIFKEIEAAGRTCYKSENFITEDSAKNFVQMLINKGHTAMLEHGTVYLTRDVRQPEFVGKYHNNPYSRVKEEGTIQKYHVTTNYRVIVENGWMDDLQYLCEPTEHHEKRVSVRFICDRGVSHELVRHRAFSFAQESTRFCNYSKDEFDNELTFIEPCWIKHHEEDNEEQKRRNVTFYMPMLEKAEIDYFALLNCKTSDYPNGWQPQQARAVLPNALKTEVVMTGFLSDWIGTVCAYEKKTNTDIPGYAFCYEEVVLKKIWCPESEAEIREYVKKFQPTWRVEISGFFPLRTSPAAHPQMRELAVPLYEQFKSFLK